MSMPPGYDPGDLPPLPPGQMSLKPDDIRYQRHITINLVDDGSYVIVSTRSESEFVCSRDGAQVAQRQRVVQQTAQTRVDMLEILNDWCNRFSDVAVGELLAEDDKRRKSN